MPSDASQTLAPGDYAAVTLEGASLTGSTVLTLTGGTYNLSTLELGARSRLECQCKCELRIEEKLLAGLLATDTYIGPVAGGAIDAGDVALFVEGANGTSGGLGELPKAATVAPLSEVKARIFVENGTLWMSPGTTAEGTFVGRDVDLDAIGSLDKDMGPTGPDCAGHCADLIAAGCSNGPTSQTACEAECNDRLQNGYFEGYCSEQHEALVLCSQCKGTASCDQDGNAYFDGCQDERAALDLCLSTCSTANDGNDCTADSCDCTPASCNPSTAVTHTPVAAGTPCPNGDLCDGDELCDGAGTCQAGTPLDVDDENPCTADSCDPSTSTITHTPEPSGTPCPNDTVCDGDETCDGAGVCLDGTPLVIDDGDPATLDTCDPIDGVEHRAVSVLDPTVATTLYDAASFLFEGADPIQTGVAPGTIEPRRIVVLRGKVKTLAGDPLYGVTVRIESIDPNEPDYGSTVTQGNGAFDMAVNGGGRLTVVFERAGYLPARRNVETPWREHVVLDDVVLVLLDDSVTTVAMNASAMQVASGSVETDADGTRQARLLVPSGTQAVLVYPDESTEAVSSLDLRLTEYTVGPSGPEAMPFALPPQSGYTYAVKLSADEALAAGAERIDFSQPVLFYLENFLGFAAGTKVPVGLLEPDRGCWSPEPDGRVIDVVGESGGMADLDSDGDGLADDAATLSALGISDEERTELAALYDPGASLWRVERMHFSDIDWNWPAPPNGCTSDDPDCAEPPDPPCPNPPCDDDCDDPAASTCEVQNQILHETIPLAGTPHALVYSSDRVAGREDLYTLAIPLTGDTVSPAITAIELRLAVAGRLFQQIFSCPCSANDSFVFSWDGIDAYGRELQGRHPVRVEIGYEVGGDYVEPADIEESFAAIGLGSTGVVTRESVTKRRSYTRMLGTWRQDLLGLGGWSLDIHHAYDPVGRRLYLGDGSRRSAEWIGPTLDTVGGGKPCCNENLGGQATDAYIGTPRGLAVGPDGSIYFADSARHVVRRIAPDGTISIVAGSSGSSGFVGDGGPATSARLNTPWDVDVGPDGSLYIADLNNNRIRRVAPDGLIETFAGDGAFAFAGDGGPATAASLRAPRGVTVAPDCNVYIADTNNGRIRRVAADGTIYTLAGGGGTAAGASPVPAGELFVRSPHSVDVGPDGSLYFDDSGPTSTCRIIRLGLDGMAERIAGTASTSCGDSGDGGPATLAQVNPEGGVSVAPDGSVHFISAHSTNGVTTRGVRKVTPGGIIRTVVGASGTAACGEPGQQVYCGEGGPASAAFLNVTGAALGPDGALFASSTSGDRIVRSDPPLVGFADSILVPSRGGSEVYEFDDQGRHLSTRHGLLGTTLYTFGYDSAGRLATVTDVDGLVTTIERDVNGQPMKIAGPYGAETLLAVDGNGYLATIENPALESWTATYHAGGLLATLSDPRSLSASFAYSTLGALTSATDRAGGTRSYTPTSTGDDRSVERQTHLGRTSTFAMSTLGAGGERRTNTFPTGLFVTVDHTDDGAVTTTLPDGRTVKLVETPDPRFGLFAPLAGALTETLPSTGSRLSTLERTVTLSNPSDPFSITSLTETSEVNGIASSRLFDGATRTWTMTSAVGRQSTLVLDAEGRTVERTVGNLTPVDFGYDLFGRLQTVTQGARTTSFTYDSLGRLASATNPLSETTSYGYDAADRLTTITRPDALVIGFDYDQAGNLTEVVPPGKPAHTFSYSGMNQLASYTAPDIGFGPETTSYAYDLDRALESITYPDASTLALAYDSAGRLSTVTLPGGTVTHGYDSLTGKLTSLSGPYGVDLTHAYDGHLLTGTTWSGAVSGTVARTYDSFFRLLTEQVNATAVVSFGYDDDGLLTQAGDLALSYDPLTALLSGTTLEQLTDSYEYNAFGELSRYTASFGATVLYDVVYTRDALGRIDTKTETIQGLTTVYDYGYDELGQLETVHEDSVLVSTYVYDDNGNRLSHTTPSGSTTGSYNAQDQLLSYGTLSFGYNGRGQLATKTDTATSDTTTYVYDIRDDLLSVSLPSGTLIEYVVDAEQQRVIKKVDGLVERGWLYRDKLRPVAELDASGAVVSRFVYTSRPNVPDYMVKGGSTYRLLHDHIGSVRLVVDVLTGTVAQRLDYDEFGRVLSDTSPGFQPFGFAGGLYDPDTGLVRFGARDYDAEVGRWAAKDPIRFNGRSTNLYRYSTSDPINQKDPDGLQTGVGGQGSPGNEPSPQAPICPDESGEYLICSFRYRTSGPAGFGWMCHYYCPGDGSYHTVWRLGQCPNEIRVKKN